MPSGSNLRDFVGRVAGLQTRIMSDAAGGYSKIGRNFADHHSVVHSKRESPGATMTLKKSFKGLNAVVPAGGEIQSLGYGRLLWLEGSQVKAALPARAQRIAQ
jgi:hypothetical protein